MSGGERFASPSALRDFALEAVTELRAAAMDEAADLLEAAATYVIGSGWEWLGELGVAAATIRSRFRCAPPLAARLDRIQRTATSRRPYGRDARRGDPTEPRA